MIKSWRAALRAVGVGCAALMLGACAGLGVSAPGPATIAERTTLDERGLLGAELAYKSARTLAEAGADAGLIGPKLAADIAQVDAKLYGALKRAREAYAAGNAATFEGALAEAAPLITELWALVGARR